MTTFCIECRHHRPNESYNRNHPESAGDVDKCAAAYREVPDFVNGGTKTVSRGYEWCTMRNNGNCKDYEPKEATDGE